MFLQYFMLYCQEFSLSACVALSEQAKHFEIIREGLTASCGSPGKTLSSGSSKNCLHSVHRRDILGLVGTSFSSSTCSSDLCTPEANCSRVDRHLPNSLVFRHTLIERNKNKVLIDLLTSIFFITFPRTSTPLLVFYYPVESACCLGHPHQSHLSPLPSWNQILSPLCIHHLFLLFLQVDLSS